MKQVVLVILFVVCVSSGVPFATPLIPRNISAVPLYKGTWSFEDISRGESGSAERGTEAKVAGGKGSGFLRKQRGDFFFGNMRTRPASAYVDAVDGQFVVRDGVYAADALHGYEMRGAYLWPIGLLLAVAEPEGAQAALNVSSLLTGIASGTSMEDLRRAFLAGERTAPHDPTGKMKGPCSLKIAFRVTGKAMIKATAQQRPRDPGGQKVPVVDPESVTMSGQITSPECGFVLRAEAHVHSMTTSNRNALYYIVFVYMLAFVEMLLLARQMDVTNTPALAARVSSTMIGLQAMLDSYYSLLHLIIAVLFSQSLFYAFSIASFIYFVKFSMFDMRYLMYVWKAQNPAMFNQDADQIRRRLSIIYIKFYSILLAGFLAVYYVRHAIYYLVIGLFSIWVPQIFSNAYQDSVASLTPHYIIGTSFTRAVIPLYFLSWPSNFIHFEPSTLFGFLLLAYLGIQVALLHMQSIRGPRFFVPRQLLPPKYNYHREVPEAVLLQATSGRLECVICMSHVDIPGTGAGPHPAEEPRQEPQVIAGEVPPGTLEEGLPVRREYMITPCNHVFHSQCLRQWLDFKLECPTCRATLPVP